MDELRSTALMSDEDRKRRREVLAILLGDAVLVAIDTAGLVIQLRGLEEGEITEEKVAGWLRQALDMDAVHGRLDEVTISDLREALASERVYVRVLRGLAIRASEEADGRRVRPALRTAVTAAAEYARGHGEEGPDG